MAALAERTFFTFPASVKSLAIALHTNLKDKIKLVTN